MPRTKRLIEQQRFHLGLVLAQPLRELFERDFQRLRTEFPHARRKPHAQLQPAELAAVIVEQHAAIERQNGVRVLARHGVHQQLAGHAQVHHEGVSAIQLDLNEFAVALDSAHLAARERRRRLVGIAAQHAQASEFRADDASPVQVRG